MSRRHTTPVVGLLIASVLGVALADAVVLDAVKAYFSSGYNGALLSDLGDRAAFFAAGAVLDLFLLSALWALLLPLSAPLRLSPARRLALVALLAAAVPVAIDVAMHRLHRVLGDVLHLDLLLDLAGGSLGNAAAEAAGELPSLLLLAGCLAAGIALSLLGAGWLERRSRLWHGLELPKVRSLLSLCLLCAVLGGALLTWSQRHWFALSFGLGWKPSGRVLTRVVDRLTDLDRDGFGLLAQPRDPSPLDPRIHPLALEIPGDGIDQDGLAGDLPADFVLDGPVSVSARPWPHRRSLVLVFLEGFRADLLHARRDGRPVTPFLRQLAQEGGSSEHSFVHTPMTWASRAQLLQGRLVPVPGARTLVDDFRARGYEVAWFSGQDDADSNGAAVLGFQRADHFYDARQDRDQRTSRSTAPISLQVSWKRVLTRVRHYLEDRRSSRPLLLYVNFVDTHFPYWHRELDDILGVGALPREHIRPENRGEVWRAYLNAAANVDRAIAGLHRAAAASLGADDFAMLVTADHGEAFYEHGILGHGQRLDASMTRVPLVLWQLGGHWPEPLALSDLRGQLSRTLGSAGPGQRPRFEPHPERRILQVAGRMGRPKRLGLRSLHHLLSYDFQTGRSEVLDPEDRPLELAPGQQQRELLRLARDWEAARLRAAQLLPPANPEVAEAGMPPPGRLLPGGSPDPGGAPRQRPPGARERRPSGAVRSPQKAVELGNQGGGGDDQDVVPGLDPIVAPRHHQPSLAPQGDHQDAPGQRQVRQPGAAHEAAGGDLRLQDLHPIPE